MERPITKFPTDCCALCQLSVDDSHSIADIEYMLSILNQESTAQNYHGTDKTMGQTAAFVITTPNETKLRKKLKQIGFTPSFQFNRRNGYPKGILTMWCINI